MIQGILLDLDGVLIKTELETFRFYQNYLKQESKKYNLIDPKKVHNIPNLELASLFFCHISLLFFSRKIFLSVIGNG